MGHKKELLPCHFDPSLEPLTIDLYRKACCGGESILKASPDVAALLEDRSQRLTFYQAAHRGFALAQAEIAGRLLSLEACPVSVKFAFGEPLLLRKLADAIAWQIIGRELYIARRLSQSQQPQRLSQSNFDSVRATAKALTSDDFSKFALISDLTTFVQLGDLLVVDAASGTMDFVEVKAGPKNAQYMQTLEAFAATKCPELVRHFYQSEGEVGVEHLRRILRQADKLLNLSSILGKGQGTDLATGGKVTVHDVSEYIHIYDQQLSALIDKSHERDWAIDIIDDALYIGAYRGRMRAVAPFIFRTWLEESSNSRRWPVLNQLECMVTALGLPVFSRFLREDQMMDLLFGRCVVYIGIRLDKVITLINDAGGHARWSTRKEAGRIRKGLDVLRSDNRVIFVRKGDTDIMVGTGMIVRMAFHGITPRTFADIYARTDEPS